MIYFSYLLNINTSSKPLVNFLIYQPFQRQSILSSISKYMNKKMLILNIQYTINKIMIKFQGNRKAISKYKVVLIGDQYAGKSSIINQFVNGQFDPSSISTLGIDFLSKIIITSNNKNTRIQLWDTAGQERFRCLIPSYLKSADCAIVVFDLTNQNSRKQLGKWIDYARENGKKQILVYVAGNKIDLEDQIKQESKIQAKSIAVLTADGYSEVSAKKNIGIQEMFENIAENLILQREGYAITILQRSGSSQSIVIDVLQEEQKTGKNMSNRSNCCYR